MIATFKNIAVLIDADNASAHTIGDILKKIESFGRITCKNIYGDWSNAHIQGWREALLTHTLNPIQQFAYVTGKNTTDIGMVIDAMDLLYSNQYDCFCLISSDSDFTALALRIRKNHVNVFGFGKKITVKAFVQACDNFYYVEDLLPLPPIPRKIVAIPQKNSAQNTLGTPKPVKTPIPITTPPTTNTSKIWTTKQLQTQTHFISILNKLTTENPKSDKGWSHLSYIASQINQHHKNIKWDKYGYKKFSDLMIALDLYEVRQINKTLSIKIKETANTTIIAKNNPQKASKAWDEQRLKCDTKLLNSLRAAINNNPKMEAGCWVNFGAVRQDFMAHYPDFTPQHYGYTKLPAIIKKISLFETKTINSTLYVRQKIS